MQHGVEKRYIILFAILIAITGFTFEAQSDHLSKTPLSTNTTTQP